MTSVQIILSRTLQVSTVHRLALEYDPPGGGPPSLFLKLIGLSLRSTDLPDNGRAEVDFYDRIGPAIGAPPLIRCLDASFSKVANASHVLLEDLTDTHFQPEDPEPPTLELSRRAVAALATVHSRYWSSLLLGNEIATVFDEHKLDSFINDLAERVDCFVAMASSELTTDQKLMYRRMVDSASRIWGRLLDPAGLTVTHGDMHWWNFLYPNNMATDSVRLFDWQLWHVDLGARDLAFLLALGGFAKLRPEIEGELLDIYHETLMSNGVTEYSRERLFIDYRWSAIRNLNIPVIFWSQGKHESTWRTALKRSFESFECMNCRELIA